MQHRHHAQTKPETHQTKETRDTQQWSLGLEHEFLVVTPPSTKVLDIHDVVRKTGLYRESQRARIRRERRHRRPLLLSTTPPSCDVISGVSLSSSPGDSPSLASGTRRLLSRRPLERIICSAGRVVGSRGGGQGTEQSGHGDDIDSDAIETDYYFVEVKSTRHERATIESVVRQVQAAEEIVVAASREYIDRRSFIFPYSGLVPDGGVGERLIPRRRVAEDEDDDVDGRESALSPRYAGSYHVWVTLPHGENWKEHRERGRLARQHALLAHRLQWIEPLLLCLMSGDPRAVGSGYEFPRASMRSSMNRWCGYGTTDPKMLLHLKWHQLSEERRRALNSRVRFYPSVAHLRFAFGDHRVRRQDLPGDPRHNGVRSGSSESELHRPSLAFDQLTRVERSELKRRMVRKLLAQQTVSLWVDECSGSDSANRGGDDADREVDMDNGGCTLVRKKVKATGEERVYRRRPLELCMDVARADWGTPGFTEGANSFQSETVFPNRNARLPYQDLLHSEGSYYNMGQGGNDIRVVGCGRSLSFPVEPGWNKAWVARNIRDLPDGRQEVELLLHFFRVRVSDTSHSQKREIVVSSSVPSTALTAPSKNDERRTTFKGTSTIASSKSVQVEGDESREARSNAIGFEFRMMDNFPSSQMTEVLRVITLMAASAVVAEATDVYTTEKAIRAFDSHRALNDASWNAALVAVSREGSRARLPRGYVSKLHSVIFGHDDRVEAEDEELSRDDRAYPCLIRLCEKLFGRYGRDRIIDFLQEKTYLAPPKPIDFNLEAWVSAFRTSIGSMPGRENDNIDDHYIRKFLIEKKRSRDPDWEGDIPYLHAFPSSSHRHHPKNTLHDAS